ncbi:serine/threonine-protein kinase [Paraliomyxa miuraensis]|uniref:serine/threonine-protein kinase n=1 Tax=Paraliomyxa miuraensis TaxID=376150 RepID=UPI0022517D9A|nr:serine/threonine-protein kinase [Paraliomyxa miuraensis]MCX4247352.1 tetratricopeptide repeat-containing serine/threonine protein kinase [Paraliomyxa miuraensis]
MSEPTEDDVEATAMGLGTSDGEALDRELKLGRPEFGEALDGLRARLTATARGLAARTVGRYRLGRELGAGAFGTVYEAEDPELDRKVAVKILGVRSSKEAARVTREAQVLATLSHPNVVQVFEVGELDEGRSLYVVMELVDGTTLRQWLAEGRRSWREVIDVTLGAAEGLMAAHRAGIIHRDFKPDNVLIGADGRPRVIDFGLARPIGGADDSSGSTLPSGASPQLTATGQVMGTPAYMAPEVFAGTCTPLSDQYCLCISLYEGLFGQRPFVASTTEELRALVLRHEASLPDDRRGVPRRVQAVVMRGLRRKPEERFADLDALRAALVAASRPRRRGWIAGVTVGAGGFVAAAMVLVSSEPAALPVPDDVALESSSEGSEPADPAQAAQAAEVAALQTEAERVRGLVATSKVADALTHSASLLERARALEHRPTLADALLLRGHALDVATDFEHAIPVLEEAYFLAEDESLPRIAAHAASLQVGILGYQADQYENAHRWKDHADAAFGRAGLDPRQHVPYMLSVAGLAMREGDQAGAIATLREAIASVERDHRARTAEHATLLRWLGRELSDQDLEAAMALTREAAEIFGEHDGPRSLTRAAALDNLGVYLANLARFEEALTYHREALELRQEQLEPKHMDLARSHGNMGRALGSLGRHDEAFHHLDRSIEIFSERLGPGNSGVAMGYEMKGMIHAGRGPEGREEALRNLDRAARIYDAAGVIYVPTAERVRTAIRELGGTPPPAPSVAIPP